MTALPAWLNVYSDDWRGVPLSIWRHTRRLISAPPKPRRRRSERKGGRPWIDDRRAFSGILWVARTGRPWEDLPPRFGSERTARRRLARWLRSGALEDMFASYLNRTTDEEVSLWATVLQSCHRGKRLDWMDSLGWTFERLPRCARVVRAS